MSRERADRAAAWATAAGIGLITFMVTWLVGNRLTTLVWGPPVGPTVAFVGAIVVGVAVALVAGQRLVRRTSIG